eukprot:2662128-Pyramimonas_sp.AAC.1
MSSAAENEGKVGCGARLDLAELRSHGVVYSGEVGSLHHYNLDVTSVRALAQLSEPGALLDTILLARNQYYR